jgi:hypothetical protein
MGRVEEGGVRVSYVLVQSMLGQVEGSTVHVGHYEVA